MRITAPDFQKIEKTPMKICITYKILIHFLYSFITELFTIDLDNFLILEIGLSKRKLNQ